MSIVPIHTRGVNKAKLVCDECQHREVLTCDYIRGADGQWSVNEGQLRRKRPDGWQLIKGKDVCASCVEKRRLATMPPKPKDSMETVPRQPTREQEVNIIVMLSAVYDRKARRYQGTETDRSVSEAIGDVMPGWVGQIRETMFGPAGNEEVDAIRAEITDARQAFAARLEAIERRLNACVTAHDKRVG